MRKAISDRAVLAVLHPFVRATRPMLAALRESDPFRLRSRVLGPTEELDRTLKDRVRGTLAVTKVPNTSAWVGTTSYHQLLGLLPVGGMLGDYLGEWSGLRQAARRATRWLGSNP